MTKSSKDYVQDNIDIFDHIPEYLRNQLNSSFSRNLFNKFLTKDESVPIYGLIGNKAINDTDDRPTIPQSTLERKINSLIPLVYAKHGADEIILSFSDIINKAKLLGIDVENFTDWGACQSFNFVPPIDIDKFINFSSYYWVGHLSQSEFKPSWNNKLLPEYYVIARPSLDNKEKYPVEAATHVNVVLTGSGHKNENWIVTFLDSNVFTVVGESSGISGTGSLNSLFSSTYLTFKITNGGIPFVAGDKFTIFTEDLTENYSFEYSGIGNGGISGIKGAQSFFALSQPNNSPSIQTYAGQRILVLAQDNPAENGIYIVRAGEWERAPDCPIDSVIGIRTFVTNGDQSLIGLWTAIEFSETSIQFSGPEEIRNISEWSQFNFWIHIDDAIKNNIDINKAIQAKRPIIEYDFDLELNTDQLDNEPIGGNALFNCQQIKHKFNQLPLFNLYLANGNSAKKVSSLFYYEENSTAPIDKHLKRRIQLDENNDYIFSQGVVTPEGASLFFKKNGQLKSMWAPGPQQSEHSIPIFNSAARQISDAEIDLTFSNIHKNIKNANWILTAISINTFELSSIHYPTVTYQINVGEPFDVVDSANNLLFSLLITPGSFEIPIDGVTLGDTIKFKTMNSEHPRYVNGETLATATEIEYDGVSGVWTTPFQLEFNAYHENRKSVHFGDLINHFKSIIGSQPGFVGSSFGRNNFRNIKNKHLGLGGRIKEHNGAFNKFIGLLNQENISPISILDFAETQYAQALNSVNEYVNKHAIDFLTAHGSPVFVDNLDISNKIPMLVDEYCSYYSKRIDVGSYLSSSTSIIPNWPATLPTIGLSSAEFPHFGFDNELGLNVIVHHDGHLSPKNQRNVEFDRGLTKQIVDRSDGTKSAGIFSITAPNLPYKNQLWFNSNTSDLKLFDVESDLSAPNNPQDNSFWFDRENDMLYQWISGSWTSVSDKTVAWKLVETDKILNGFILDIEQRLFESIHPNQEVLWNAAAYTSIDTLEFELAKFAAKYGYDQFAPDFQMDDPFTWNYKEADIPLIGTGNSRWHDIYKNYFAAATGSQFTTCRPNLEPWKLLGYNDMPIGFDQTYAGVSSVDSSLSMSSVSVILLDELVNVTSCPNIIDGKSLIIGERILVARGANLGVYTVVDPGNGNNGIVSFASDFNPFDLLEGTNLEVTAGQNWANTKWTLINNNGQLEFEQVRRWKIQLWMDIIQAFPSMKLCVNIFNEQLLPPYVDPLSNSAVFGLLNIAPINISNAYSFGDNGPTEAVWKKSLEHSYSLLRSSMKNQPLLFLERAWGDVYRSVDGLKLDKQYGKKISHKEFILHSENSIFKKYARIVYSSELPVSISSDVSVDLVCDLVTDEQDFFKIFVDGIFVGRPSNFDSSFGIDFSDLIIDDNGLGFEIGDSISFSIDSTGKISNEVFVPAKTKTYLGIGQLYSQLLKYNSYSLTESKNSIMFREWDANLGYRFGAFMNTDTLQLSSNAFDIPLGLCKVLTKVSPYADSSWLNAIRIQLVQVGTTVLEDSIYKPANMGDDWVFRIETYFNRHPKISYYEVDTSGDFQTFNAIDNRRSTDTWKNYTSDVSVNHITTPIIITGIQNVVNFLFGYTRYVQDAGWEINASDTPDIDSETGRLITWQLEIEKFIDASYNNMTVGSGVIINPFMKNIWFNSPKGLTSKFESVNFLDVSASQFAFDITGSQIPIDNLKIIREEDVTSIIAETPMFGLHLNVEHYEHCVLYPYYLDNTKKQHLIFDPFLGMKLNKILVKGSRQAVQSARPSFGGFYLRDNKMKKNIISSIDDLGKMYDANSAFDNPDMSKHALALFGFSNKEYFTQLGTTPKNQFNFWRGMIQAKGTNSSIDAFLNNSAYEDAKIDEYWAFKIAEYGDARTKSFPELKLKASDSLLDTTRFQFYDNNVPTEILPGFNLISSKDENRWSNLKDLEELKSRGMYFDAVQIGKVIVKEKPQITNLINSGIGKVKFVDDRQSVFTFCGNQTITVVMNDIDAFTVFDSSMTAIGNGNLDVLFQSTTFEFQVTTDLFEMQQGDTFTFDISTSIENLVRLPFASDKLIIRYADTTTSLASSDDIEIVTQNVILVKTANVSFSVEGFGPQKPKFSPIKLFDYKSDTFIGNIPFWNPAIGQHTPEAFEIINMVSPADPAKYNQTTQTLNNPNFDLLKPWGNREVGKVWWNTTNLDYVPYYDKTVYPDIEHRLSKWGALAEYSNVEVYEWIESDVPPTEYDAKVLSDAKDTNIPQSEKKSGQAANAKLLTRSRTWNVRPIAWKNKEDYDSPFLTSALFNKISVTSPSVGKSRAILNYGRFSDYNISTGMSLSGWDFLRSIPVGQATINETVDYVLGSETNTISPYLVSSDFTLTIDKSKKLSSVGKCLGKISLTNFISDGIYYVKATEVNTGKSQTLPVYDIDSNAEVIEFDFNEIGIRFQLSLTQ